jgi:hypothetical protein
MMKSSNKLFLFKIICVAILVLAATFAGAQNKDYLISMNGLGALKLGLSKVAVEKILGQKIQLANQFDTTNYMDLDTAKLIYKNIPVQLEFKRNYAGPGTFYMRLIGIRASSPLCKTASGIGIGTDKSKIIAAYDSYALYIQPGYANYYATEEGEGKSTIIVTDDAATATNGAEGYTMMFFLMNKKLASFELKASFNN